MKERREKGRYTKWEKEKKQRKDERGIEKMREERKSNGERKEGVEGG